MPTPDPSQAADAAVFTAGQVRIAQLCEAIVQAKYYGADTKHLVFSVNDIGGGLTEAGRSKERTERNAIFGYLQERYGLLALGLDPIWHALFRDASPMGTTVRPFVLAANGFVLGGGDFVLGAGARLVLNAAPPAFNTHLSPGGTVEAVTFNGNPDSVFSFDMPLPDSNDGPVAMFLMLGGMQVGRVDFPMTAVGAPFSLLEDGVLYYGVFTGDVDQDEPELVDLTLP